MTTPITIDVLAHGTSADTDAIDTKIKAMLARGSTVCFTNRFSGVVKHVTEWNPDENGDLVASYSTGTTKFVCPYACEYDITEIPNNG